MIKCSICSYQCDNWYVSNWRLACHINFSLGRCPLELAQRPSSVALALHLAGSSTPLGVTILFIMTHFNVHVANVGFRPSTQSQESNKKLMSMLVFMSMLMFMSMSMFMFMLAMSGHMLDFNLWPKASSHKKNYVDVVFGFHVPMATAKKTCWCSYSWCILKK